MHINDILNIANPKQLEAIKHPLAPLMIIAGAGTGKTFTLENRIVYMIQKYEVEPKNILTITYTEKAANELKSRLINKVGQKAHPMFVGTFHSFCYKLMKDYQINSNECFSSLLEKVFLISFPRGVLTGIFCRLGLLELNLPVAVTACM